MSSPPAASPWQIIAASVIGSNHVRHALPNQDAHGYRVSGEQSQVLVLAVSDGHGSRRYIRSEHGARIAVEVALELLLEIAGQEALSNQPSAAKSALETRFPPRCLREWLRHVQDHLAAHPLTERERDTLATDYAEKPSPQRVAAWYGATLVAAVVTPKWGASLQLGDGNLVWVTGGGEAFEAAVPIEELLGDETHSLCSADAAGLFRVSFQRFESTPPALLLLCTDGYSKSFAAPNAVRRAAADLLQLARAEGVETIRSQFAGWLAESASDQGGGDDTTVLVALRSPLEKFVPPVSPAVTTVALPTAASANSPPRSVTDQREKGDFKMKRSASSRPPSPTAGDEAARLPLNRSAEHCSARTEPILPPAERCSALRPASGAATAAVGGPLVLSQQSPNPPTVPPAAAPPPTVSSSCTNSSNPA